MAKRDLASKIVLVFAVLIEPKMLGISGVCIEFSRRG